MPPAPSISRVYTKEELCLMEKVADPCGIVIFGASGDLTRRKLIPSLFKLAQDNVLPKDYYILGVARTDLSDASFQDKIREDLSIFPDTKTRSDFIKRCKYLPGDYGKVSLYEGLRKRLSALDLEHGVKGRRIFYLSTPPQLYETLVQQLGASGLASPRNEEGWVRVVIEKPFGRDLASAETLNRAIRDVFQEDQIYRIDHYLGK